MARSADLLIRIGASLAGLEKGIRDAEKILGRGFQAMNRAADRFTAQLTVPIVAVGSFAIQAGAEFEKLRAQLDVFTDSAAQTDALFQEIQRRAAETPFALADIAGATRQLLAFGFSIDETSSLMDTLQEASAATGARLQDLTLITGQARAIGKAYTLDLRQLANRGIPVFAELQRITGVTGDQFDELVRSGGITSEILIQALDNMASATGLFGGATKKVLDTTSGQWIRFREQLTITAGGIGEDILKIFDVKGALDSLTNFFSGILEEWNKLEDSSKGLIAGFIALVAAVGPAIKAFAALRAVLLLLSGPIGIVITAIGLLVVALVRANEKYPQVTGGIYAVIRVFQLLGEIIVEAVLEPLRLFIDAVDEILAGNFLKGAGKLADSLLKVVGLPVNIAIKVAERWEDLGKAAAEGYEEGVQSRLSAFPIPLPGEGGTSGTSKQTIPDLLPQGAKNQIEAAKLLYEGFYDDLGDDIAVVTEAQIALLDSMTRRQAIFNSQIETTNDGYIRVVESIGHMSTAQETVAAIQERNQENLDNYIATWEQFGILVRDIGETTVDWLGLAYDGLSILSSELNKGIVTWAQFGQAAVRALVQVIGKLVQQAIAAAIANSALAAGPFGALAAAAAGVAIKGIMSSLLRGIPQFGDGGVVYGPTLALVGEKGPEMITPLRDVPNKMGAHITATFKIRNRDLVAAYDAGKQDEERIF